GRGAAAEPAVPALRRALTDPDARVRASAALALGAVGKAAAGVLDDLRRALKDKDAEVRFSAQLSLRRLDAAP
ncbi:MAG: HEAT repeat domain-containing protein, partial [Elusimicrobia bacterium]|nr:HEAT repeat domain-containing protein [Elusimicrobiota bacterium]